MVGDDFSTTVDRGTAKRVPELLLMILTSIPLGILINQISGILDSIGRNEFNYNPTYLASVSLLLIVTLVLFWILAQSVRHVRIVVITQVLIDSKKGEVPYIKFKNHEGNYSHFKPQVYLANAFVMMKVSTQMIASIEKYGGRAWMVPSVPPVESEREERIRKGIIEFYSDSNEAGDNPVYDLFDCVLADYLQNAMYMARRYGIEEREYVIIHDRREKTIGGFKARSATEEDPKRVSPDKLPPTILKVEPIFIGESDSRSVRVRIPKSMRIKDISSNGIRGFSIFGNGINLEISYEGIRHTPLNGTELIMRTGTGRAETGVVAEQLELTAHLKMTILGFLRYRSSYRRMIRWTEDYIHALTSEFDWPTFQARNRIHQIERHILE